VIQITREERFNEKYNFYKNEINEKYSDLYNFINFEYKINDSGKIYGIITVRHKICGEIFSRNAATWKNNKKCLICTLDRSVSLLHASMCYYGKQTYPESKFEYNIGFKGDNGGTSKYDLFIPKYLGKDTLFEFQSRFHDYKTDLDKRKKSFAENSGYNFISIDSRSISPIDAVYNYYKIKVSEKDIQENFLFKKKHDMEAVQSLLDENLTVKEISKITKISENVIYHNMCVGNFVLKENRKEVLYGKCPVIQLTLSGEYMREFDSGWSVYKELGFKVDSCVAGLTRHAHGYLFIKKEDYECGNYKIPKKVRLFNKI